jgi:hypothetical protein
MSTEIIYSPVQHSEIDVKVLVCGDQEWKDKELIRYYLTRTLPSMGYHITDIIEGDARGADKLAGELANELMINLIKVPAAWEQFGRMAGPIRNVAMLQYEPNIVLAFHDDLSNSKGTLDMINKARRYGKATILLCSHGVDAEVVTDQNVQI